MNKDSERIPHRFCRATVFRNLQGTVRLFRIKRSTNPSKARPMIHCRRCRNYYITWDKDFPHGCQAMNFKSHQMPSTAVYENFAKTCLAFTRKDKKNARRLNTLKK